jgi:RNA-directed DNA polymerase
MVLLSEDREELERWERGIATFLRDALRLALNERRRLRPVSDGVDFLGYVTRPDYLLPRRRVVGALKDRLERTGPGLTGAPDELVPVERWLGSYLAHFARASSHRLVAALRQRHTWLDRHFRFRPGRSPRLRIHPSRRAALGPGW